MTDTEIQARVRAARERAARAAVRAAEAAERTAAVHEAAARELERHATVVAALWENVANVQRLAWAHRLRLSGERQRRIASPEYEIVERIRPRTDRSELRRLPDQSAEVAAIERERRSLRGRA